LADAPAESKAKPRSGTWPGRGPGGARYNSGVIPPARIRSAEARSILTRTSGFIRQAGFTHSLTPARNCTFACIYCYVPTLKIYGGLQREDWERWGQFTTFKQNAPELLRRALRPEQRIYCSPLVDPYQPAEGSQLLMPRLLEVLAERPPALVVIQTRGPLILRDLGRLTALARRTRLRISFSITTDREDVRRRYEPLCAPLAERWEAVSALRAAGLAVHATLAPLLPCNPETLAEQALAHTDGDILGDPFHVRSVKACGATTRPQAYQVSQRHGFLDWHEPEFQHAAVECIRARVAAAGRRFGVGPEAFGWLAIQ